MKRWIVAVSLIVGLGWMPDLAAQSMSPAWDAYRKQSARPQSQRSAPAQPQAQPQAQSQDQPPQQRPLHPGIREPSMRALPATSDSAAQADDASVAAPATVQDAGVAATAASPVHAPARAPRQQGAWNQSGAFVNVHGGRGWVYDSVDQNAVTANAGYRWRAGPVSLVGVEVGGGRLSETRKDGYIFPEVEFFNIGANARFTFGVDSRMFGIARAGYWRADARDGGERFNVDGGYASVGLGVDVSRNIGISLVYTAYVYASDYYFNNGYYREYGTEVNRADTLGLGLEARF